MKDKLKKIIEWCGISFAPKRKGTRIYSVGLPRSGTKSIADILSPFVPAEHEPLHKETITHLLNWKRGQCSRREIKEFLKRRDERLGLKAESSHFMHYFIDEIKDIFDDVFFIMTVREPMGWIESEFNQNIKTRNLEYWRNLEKYRYKRYENKYKIKELKSIENVYPIKSYLDYWQSHVKNVFSSTSKKERKIINTYRLSEKVNEILKVSGVEGNISKIENKRSNKSSGKPKIYKYISKKELSKMIKNHQCIEVINKRLNILVGDMEYLSSSSEIN